jgi:hypothetical protein
MVAFPKLHIDSSDLPGAVEDAYSAQGAITATAGGGQANGLLLTRSFSRVSTVATAADSVKLPPAKAGAQMIVFNKAAANSLNVFPSTGDIINALSANSAYALAVTKGAMFVCTVDGTWDTILTA